jgi:hypothetical protein
VETTDVGILVRDCFAKMIFRASVALEADRKINRFTGRNFTPFKYVYWDENKMSDIIADLLNPAGEHGQGDLFLRQFVKYVLGLDENSLNCSKTIVQREALTRNIKRQQRSIDILLTGSNWVCAIENKPRATQQDEQLEAYMQHVKSLDKDEDKTFLVFLSPYNIEPQSFDTNKNGFRWGQLNSPTEIKATHEYITVSFFDWTKACQEKCEAENVRRFIADFVEWVNYQIWG